MMKYITRALMCALVVVGVVATGAVGQDVYVGTVTRIDQPAHVIIFDDGRMYRIAPNTVVLVDNQPMVYTSLQPGTRIVVRGGEAVAFRDGQYVLVSAPAMAPVSTTTVTTVTTTTSPILASASGVVASYDPRTNIVTLTDGRMVQVTSKTAILVNGYPTTADALYPGMPVMLSAINPVVSRDGRSVTLNEGFFDPGNGSALTWDAKYEGYEADTDNAAMQVQGGG
jgi:hypothetical protein